MRKGSLIVIFLSFFLGMQAQFTGYTEIPSTSDDISQFLPEGWILDYQCEADLNGDGFTDFVFVVRWDKPVSGRPGEPIIQKEEKNDTPMVRSYHPTLLLIVFYNPLTGEYCLTSKSDTFIVNSRDGLEYKNFEKVIADDCGNLIFTFRYVRSFSSMDIVTYATYTLRYHNGRFELIKEEKQSSNIPNIMHLGERHEKIDYLTRIRSIKNSDKDTWQTETFEMDDLFTLEDISGQYHTMLYR